MNRAQRRKNERKVEKMKVDLLRYEKLMRRIGHLFSEVEVRQFEKKAENMRKEIETLTEKIP